MKKWTLLLFLLPLVSFAQHIDFDKAPYKSSFTNYLQTINQKSVFDTLNTGYTTLQYHSFSSKGQFIKANHQQYFTDFLLFNLNFEKFSQEGIYKRENLNLHNVKANFLFNNRRNNYQAKLNLGYHKIKMDENGGIISYAFGLDDPLLNNIYLLSAQNEAKNRNHSLYQKFNLTDNWSIHNEFSILSNRRVYSDQSPNSGFYQDIYMDSLQTNDSLSTSVLSNSFGISYNEFTISQLIHTRKAYINNVDSTLIDYGIAANYVNQKYQIHFKSNLFQSSHLDLSILKYFNIHSSANQVFFKYDRTRVPILVNSYSSNHYRFDNDFRNTKSIAFAYNFSLKNYSFSSIVKRYTDFIYLDQRAHFQQHTKPILYWHNTFNFKLNWKNIYLTQSMEYHYSDNTNILRFPNFNSTSSLWLESKLFGDNLNTQIGANLNYFTAHYAKAYNPTLAMYQLQDNQFVGDVPLLTAFLNLKVNNMSISMKYRNLIALFNSNSNVHYYIPNYPNYPALFQLSIVWKLNNSVE